MKMGIHAFFCIDSRLRGNDTVKYMTEQLTPTPEQPTPIPGYLRVVLELREYANELVRVAALSTTALMALVQSGDAMNTPRLYPHDASLENNPIVHTSDQYAHNDSEDPLISTYIATNPIKKSDSTISNPIGSSKSPDATISEPTSEATATTEAPTFDPQAAYTVEGLAFTTGSQLEITITQDIAHYTGLDAGSKITLNLNSIDNSEQYPELVARSYDYDNYPNDAVVYPAPGDKVVLTGHSFWDDTKSDENGMYPPLPLNFLRDLAKNAPDKGVGLRLPIILTDPSGKQTSADLIITSATTATLDEYKNALVINPELRNSPPHIDPHRLDPNSQGSDLYQVVCEGEHITDEAGNTDYYYRLIYGFNIVRRDPVADYIYDTSEHQTYGVNHHDSRIVTAAEAHPNIAAAFTQHPYRATMLKTATLLYPDQNPRDIMARYRDHILLGPAVDTYLLRNQGGSYGTTIPGWNGTRLTYDTISFDQTMLEAGVITPELTVQETIQAMQRDVIARDMSQYLAEVTGADSPEGIAYVINVEMRPFLELVQQQFLYDHGIYGNAYFFNVNGVIANHLGTADNKATVEGSFTELNRILLNITGREWTVEELMNPTNLTVINQQFQEQYNDDHDFWHLFGLGRPIGLGGGELNLPPEFFLPNLAKTPHTGQSIINYSP